jgi:hypothetical protein
VNWARWRPKGGWADPRVNPPKSQADRDGHTEAHDALEAALTAWPEVQAVTEELRGIRRRNHLAEMTEAALRGTP